MKTAATIAKVIVRTPVIRPCDESVYIAAAVNPIARYAYFSTLNIYMNKSFVIHMKVYGFVLSKYYTSAVIAFICANSASTASCSSAVPFTGRRPAAIGIANLVS